jgi:trimethylamine--corrinoid protein Co-methyltransferase
MSTGVTSMGSIETAMLDVACAQVGKHLGLPTHGYLVNSDGKYLDAQAGMESGMSALLGTLAGINMISGAGMLDFVACHSLEKLVVDAEAIASARRLCDGIEPQGNSLAVAMFAQAGLTGDFLKLKETRALFRYEQHFPSAVIDRGGPSGDGAPDLFARARTRVEELLAGYQRPGISPEREQAMLAFAEREGAKVGLHTLPGVHPALDRDPLYTHVSR